MTELTVDLYSFGFLYSGIPEDLSGNNGGFVFDCRFLPNPGRESEYADKTGKDIDVIEYLQKYPEVQKFIDCTKVIVDMAIENFQQRGFTHLMISYGCSGGQHRSVYCAEQLYAYLKTKPIKINLHHIEQT